MPIVHRAGDLDKNSRRLVHNSGDETWQSGGLWRQNVKEVNDGKVLDGMNVTFHNTKHRSLAQEPPRIWRAVAGLDPGVKLLAG